MGEANKLEPLSYTLPYRTQSNVQQIDMSRQFVRTCSDMSIVEMYTILKTCIQQNVPTILIDHCGSSKFIWSNLV